MVVRAYNPSTQQVEAGRSLPVLSWPVQHSEFRTSLNYEVRSCLKNKNKTQNKQTKNEKSSKDIVQCKGLGLNSEYHEMKQNKQKQKENENSVERLSEGVTQWQSTCLGSVRPRTGIKRVEETFSIFTR